MASRHPKFSAAVLFAALGFGACQAADDTDLGTDARLRVAIVASSATREDTGIAEWRLRVDDDETLVVTGVDHGGSEIASFVMRSTDSEIRVDAHGMSVGLVRFVESGEIVENTLDDGAVLAAFRRDGTARLDRLTPRTAAMSTCTAAVAEGMSCGGLTAVTDPDDALTCGVAIAASVLECQLAPTWFATPNPAPQRDAGRGGGGGAGGGGGGGYDGGGYDGGGYDGGGYDGGGYDGGGYDGGGYDGGGYDGGGYDGGGYDGGGYDGGGYDGGGYDGGGYDGGGYDGGGYDGGGYNGAVGPKPSTQLGIPDRAEHNASLERLLISAWNIQKPAR